MTACPHCHLPLPADPGTGALPTHCPHCGQALGDGGARGSSIASLLRPAAPSDVGHFSTPAPVATLRAEPPAIEPTLQPDMTRVHLATATAAESLDTTFEDTVPQDAPMTESTPSLAPASDDELDTAAAAPSFLRAPPPVVRTVVPGWQWTLLVVLGALLMLQLLVADRARLAQDVAWRPTLERLCGALRCTLPAWQQPQDYTMLTRDVQPMPDADGMLRVRATFRNDAPWPQPWPAIVLSLSDADGRVTGARTLVPADYLEPGLRGTTLAPGQSGQMTLPIREPQGGAVAFAFAFR